jgi:hypothetical protein
MNVIGAPNAEWETSKVALVNKGHEANAALIVTACNSHYELVEALKAVDAECTCAIAYEPLPKDFPRYKTHDEVPNGLRTVAHIKLSMIREYARAALAKAGAA